MTSRFGTLEKKYDLIVLRMFPRNHPWWSITKKFTNTDFFIGIFLNFLEQVLWGVWVTASVICKICWKVGAFLLFFWYFSISRLFFISETSWCFNILHPLITLSFKSQLKVYNAKTSADLYSRDPIYSCQHWWYG